MDYANGKIYKLVSNMTDKIYIGSTTQPLSKRKFTHKADYNFWLSGKRRYVSSFEIFQVGGDIEIVLIEEFPCASKIELESRERFHIENNVCVNRFIPAQTHEERLEKAKAYREANKEQKGAYREANKEAIAKQTKDYREANKEAIREHLKAYYKANRETIRAKVKERVNCPHCNKELNRGSLSGHIKTQH